MVQQTPDAQTSGWTGLEVATIQWPAQAARREDRLAHGEPNLLLVEPGAVVPDVDLFLEDWTYTTALPTELDTRRSALTRRARARRDAASRLTTPTLDPVHNVLRLGDRSLILAPIEVRLLRAFLGSPGSVLSRDTLIGAVWPDGAPKSNTLTVQLARLRKRVAPLRLSILTFPNHGYLLELPGQSIVDGSGAASRSTRAPRPTSQANS